MREEGVFRSTGAEESPGAEGAGEDVAGRAADGVAEDGEGAAEDVVGSAGGGVADGGGVEGARVGGGRTGGADTGASGRGDPGRLAGVGRALRWRSHSWLTWEATLWSASRLEDQPRVDWRAVRGGGVVKRSTRG